MSLFSFGGGEGDEEGEEEEKKEEEKEEENTRLPTTNKNKISEPRAKTRPFSLCFCCPQNG